MTRSSSSRRESHGVWTRADALWNYLDVPHLNFVHSAVSGKEFFSSDEVSISIFEQSIFSFRFQALTAIVKRRADLIEYVTTLPLVRLHVETQLIETLSGCRAITTYTVTTSFILRPFHRLVHWSLGRNYRLLMSEDLPMREQRASLRHRGVTFIRDEDQYGFAASKRIQENNVVPAHGQTEIISLACLEASNGERVRHYLSSGMEILFEKRPDSPMVRLLPGICPHEGAPLGTDLTADSSDCRLQCPWHGREFKVVELQPDQVTTLGRLEIAYRDFGLAVTAVRPS